MFHHTLNSFLKLSHHLLHNTMGGLDEKIFERGLNEANEEKPVIGVR